MTFVEERRAGADGASDASVVEGADQAAVVAHLPLAHALARRFSSPRCDEEELFAVASLAIVNAARTFDWQRGSGFTAYARVSVTRAIVRHVSKNDHAALQIPERQWEKIRAAHRRLRDAEDLDEQERALVALGTPAASLNTPLPEGGELIDLIPADGESDGVVRFAIGLRAITDIGWAVRQLDGLQETVIRLHYGLDDGVAESYLTIARRLGYSERHVRRVGDLALAKLRHPYRSARFRDYQDEDLST